MVDAEPIEGYRVPDGSCDELVENDGTPRPHVASLIGALQRLGPAALAAAGERRDAIFMQQGITFEVAGSDGERRDRAWPLDLVPRVIPAAEWTVIKRGLAQRIRALNAFVDDVYHAHEIVRAGIVPWSLIVSRPSFARQVHGIRAPGGVYCHVSGCDLVRGGDERWWVLEDNVRTPSGISYVLENRLAMTRLVPELFAGHRIRPVDNYPSLLLESLRAVAPAADGNPNIVLWTPGPMNSAYFEHAFLARQMGIELVEASDLVVRDAVCYMRTTAGLQRVHAIYRRLDDDFIDPLEFRPDSLLGVPGLIRAYRAGTVAIANAIGTGVADDKAIYHYVPEMIRFYLGEEPILDNVPTYLLSDEQARAHVLGRLAELVVKPTSESGGKGVFIGPHASAAELEAQRRLVEAQPERWIAQELVHLSTAPTETGDGKLSPRHVDLRPFAVFGDEIRIVPGGLTRVALVEGSMIVNSSQGGGSKDTWVLDDGEVGSDPAPGTLPAYRPPRLPDVRYGGWQGQAQQQQQ
ncbi:MAG TPA: circularly permuted type 2 ATP-grasp protein [Solirubrobacteraceae bacterium]|nr:circularly permuted type 2 ATP-grasp protein [Solirubrobacteraceae bacterium]